MTDFFKPWPIKYQFKIKPKTRTIMLIKVSEHKYVMKNLTDKQIYDLLNKKEYRMERKQ